MITLNLAMILMFVDGILIPMIRFADGIVLKVEIEHELQRAPVKMKMLINEYHMRINSSETKPVPENPAQTYI